MGKQFKNIFISILVLGLISFLTHISYQQYLKKQEYINSKFNGIINYIDYHCDGCRGLPLIKIDSSFYHLGIHEIKICDFIQVGDSIVKESGSETIKVCKKDKRGNWKVYTIK